MKNFQGMVEYLIVFPIVLLIGVFLLPASYLYSFLFIVPIYFLAGLLFRRLVTYQKRFVSVFYCFIISLPLLVIYHETIIAMVIFLLLGLLSCYRGIMHGEKSWHEIFPVSYLWGGGLSVYFISYFLYQHVEALFPYRQWINWFGIIVIVVILFVSNSTHLKAATLSKKNNPVLATVLKRHNQMYIIWTITVAVIITNFVAVQALFINVIRFILSLIIAFFSLFSSDGQTEQEQSTQTPMILPGEEQQEPSLLWIWVERIFMALIVVAVVGVVIMLLVKLFKKFRHSLQRLLQTIKEFLNKWFNISNQQEVAKSYTDEKESLFDWYEWRKQSKHSVKKFLSKLTPQRIKWNSLSDQEKVRYLYRELIVEQTKRGYQYRRSNTVHETVSELGQHMLAENEFLRELEDCYHKVRYGEGDVDDISSLLSTYKRLSTNKRKG
ncbi:DUF4129 domain-containing protein [Radiobacillus sp. PE A8.2]|uniref:DUF4129 domain-containing protein n=1 Tax=Radiobacillus sp. PE A8.2 TaxID=3380349 RepID=UPI00388EBB0E